MSKSIFKTPLITALTLIGLMSLAVMCKKPVPVQGVSITPASVTINDGDSYQLQASVTPADADNPNVVWSSSDPSVVTVDQTGRIKATSYGASGTKAVKQGPVTKATIMVTTEDGGKTARCEVTVNVLVKGISLDITNLTLDEDQSAKLTETVYPDNTTNQSVNWSSSDESVATVDQDGLVTAHMAGTTTITAKAEGSAISANCLVTVIAHATGVTLDKSSITLYENESYQFKAEVAPERASNKNVSWSSSDETIATVDQDGRMHAIRSGKAVITVTAEDGGHSAECEVNVLAHVSGVSLDKSSVTIDEGKTTTLKATVAPADAADKSVSWSSSNPAVATVDSKGTVTGIVGGKAIITVTTTDGGFTASCEVSVNTKHTDGNHEGTGSEEWEI